MRKVFIDGGANVGQSIEAFCNHYPNAEEYEIHSFEASQSPNVLGPLNTIVGAFRDKVKSIDVHNKAIWIHNGTIDFYDAGTESSSILYRTGMVNNTSVTKRKVDCIDMGDCIKSNFTKEDHIVLKLDIEGAEYQVIPKLCEDGVFDYIDRFYCEIHGSKIEKNYDQSMHLLREVEKRGKSIYFWAADSYGEKGDIPYDDLLLGREYIKWHTRDIAAAYMAGDMDDADGLTEEILVAAINTMVENKIWKTRIKGTRYWLDLSSGQTLIWVRDFLDKV